MAMKSSLERAVLMILIILTALSILACYYRFLILEDLEAFYDDYSEMEEEPLETEEAYSGTGLENTVTDDVYPESEPE